MTGWTFFGTFTQLQVWNQEHESKEEAELKEGLLSQLKFQEIGFFQCRPLLHFHISLNNFGLPLELKDAIVTSLYMSLQNSFDLQKQQQCPTSMLWRDVTRSLHFFGKGKKTARTCWQSLPDLTVALQALVHPKPCFQTLKIHLPLLEQFVTQLYGVSEMIPQLLMLQGTISSVIKANHFFKCPLVATPFINICFE